MIIYQSEATCWTANVLRQNIETHISAGDQYAGEAEILRRWAATDDIPSGARLVGRDRDTGADIWDWEADAQHNG